MSTLIQNLQSLAGGNGQLNFNARRFIQENFTRSWVLLLWLVVLFYISGRVVSGQLAASPIITIVILLAWLISLSITAINEVTRRHSLATHWLRDNLYSSFTNALLTLVLTLLIVSAIRGFWGYAVVRASFSTDAEVAAQTLAQWENPGANWGAVIDNFRNLMVFRFPREEQWRILTTLFMLIGLAIPSIAIYREQYRRSVIRRVWTVLWLLSPFVAFILLLGIKDSSFLPWLNPEQFWGGLLLTIIISVFAIVASFPLGLLLALGRRSQIRGIPAWLTYGAAIAVTIWGLATSTPQNLEAARSLSERILAFWPLMILLIAFLFQRNFNGNVVALGSTLYIEVVRGVPLITVLFMSIILFPILLPPGTEILGTWRVMVAVALFAAAYLAENVRGGLQSISKGQYEAADAIGLNTFQKYRQIILPQALRAVIPAIVGQFIGLFKDTTLVAIVGLLDLLGVANLISAQPDWLGVRREPYIFIAFIYFVGSAIMAGYSRRLEARLGVGER